MPSPTLFTTFISMIGVPHTATYSDREYKSYPPKLSFMAFADLLYEYHVGREQRSCPADAESLQGLLLPCVVQMQSGRPRILTAVSSGSVTTIASDGTHHDSIDDFLGKWSGKYIEATPTAASSEPDYRRHRMLHLAAGAEHITFRVLVAAFAAFFFVSNRLYGSWSLILLTLSYAAGIAVCSMLTLKQYNVHSASAEAVCSMIQPKGCSTVVNSEQGSFFGLFHWSEIGLTYFSVSLAALLLHPAIVNYLAYISILCLPYTLWSVYTQHSRLHSWCTLCLTVQALFWIIFGLCLGGGHLHSLFPLQWSLALLLGAYALVLLFFHKILPAYFAYEIRNTPDSDIL